MSERTVILKASIKSLEVLLAAGIAELEECHEECEECEYKREIVLLEQAIELLRSLV